MRLTIACLALAAVAPVVTACAPLGERSTIAELADRCEDRRGTLVAGNSEAEGGVRCLTPVPAGSPGSAGRTGQMSVAVTQRVSNGVPST